MKKHTDLDGVKQVASALLFTDIEKTKYSPMVVQHPFTNTGVTAISVEGSFQLLNLLENPKDLDMWRQSMRQQIHNAETPYQIYCFKDDPVILQAVQKLHQALGEENLVQGMIMGGI